MGAGRGPGRASGGRGAPRGCEERGRAASPGPPASPLSPRPPRRGFPGSFVLGSGLRGRRAARGGDSRCLAVHPAPFPLLLVVRGGPRSQAAPGTGVPQPKRPPVPGLRSRSGPNPEVFVRPTWRRLPPGSPRPPAGPPRLAPGLPGGAGPASLPSPEVCVGGGWRPCGAPSRSSRCYFYLAGFRALLEGRNEEYGALSLGACGVVVGLWCLLKVRLVPYA